MSCAEITRQFGKTASCDISNKFNSTERKENLKKQNKTHNNYINVSDFKLISCFCIDTDDRKGKCPHLVRYSHGNRKFMLGSLHQSYRKDRESVGF